MGILGRHMPTRLELIMQKYMSAGHDVINAHPVLNSIVNENKVHPL